MKVIRIFCNAEIKIVILHFATHTKKVTLAQLKNKT